MENISGTLPRPIKVHQLLYMAINNFSTIHFRMVKW